MSVVANSVLLTGDELYTTAIAVSLRPLIFDDNSSSIAACCLLVMGNSAKKKAIIFD